MKYIMSKLYYRDVYNNACSLHTPQNRSDEDSSEGDDGPSKPVPEWAKGKRLQEQLVHQVRVGAAMVAGRNEMVQFSRTHTDQPLHALRCRCEWIPTRFFSTSTRRAPSTKCLVRIHGWQSRVRGPWARLQTVCILIHSPTPPTAEKQNNGQRDFSRRTSTGNWAEDRLTWQEELRYKKAMGFI